MDTFVIRPAVAGARLHDPVTGDVLAAEGEEKPRVGFWLHCLARGDVEEVEAKAAAPVERPADKPTEVPADKPALAAPAKSKPAADAAR